MSFRLDLPRLATAIALIGIFAMAVRVPASPDMWWHLRCGEVQWRTRAVLKTETFSHTAPGAPWVNQSWLPQLGLYALHAWGGFPALALAVGLLVAIAFALVGGTIPAPTAHGGRGAVNLTLCEAAPGRDAPQGLAAWWAPYWRAGVLLWAAIASGPTWAARPHLLTLLFTALWLYLLERWRAHGRRIKDLLWLPPLMLLWANSHGGYVVGLILLLIEVGGIALAMLLDRAPSGHRDAPSTKNVLSHTPVAAASPCRDGAFLLLIALLCLIAASINPQGIHLLLFPFRTLGSVQQSAIAEWASPDFHARELWPFLGLLLATWAALALSPLGGGSSPSPVVRPPTSLSASVGRTGEGWGGGHSGRPQSAAIDLLQALCFTAMALRSSRYVGLAAVVLAPLLIRYGAAIFAGIPYGRRTVGTPGRPVLNWTLLALVLLAAGLKVARPLDAQTIDDVHRQRFPVEAAGYLLSGDLPPELFNEYGWGGYLIWAAHSDAGVPRVFIDGRADPYGDELIGAYQRAIAARPGWEDTLERYGVRTALIGADSALRSVMLESERWREVYADEVAAILTRETGP